MNSVIAYIGLGSNLSDPINQVQSALNDLSQEPMITELQASSLYRSTPLGGMEQPDYINAVARITTTLTPDALLEICQQIEQSHGRDRTTGHWSARTLDLDIILYGQEIIQTDTLTIPHYGMHERNFVLIPLAELDPDLLLPDNMSIHDALTKITTEGLVKVER